MQTIRIRVSNKIYRHLMWFLGRFSDEEIQVIHETENFSSVLEYLKQELNKVEDGKAEYIGIEQLDDHLEATIRKYEA